MTWDTCFPYLILAVVLVGFADWYIAVFFE